MKRIKILLLLLVIILPSYQGMVSTVGNTSTSWSNFYISSNSYFNFKDMVIDSNDNIIIIGDVVGNNLPGNSSAKNSNFSGGIIKLDSHGSLIWSNYFGGSNIEDFLRVKVDSTNNILVFGLSYSKDLSFTNNYTFGPEPKQYYTNFLVKYSPSGSLLWTTLYRNTFFNDVEDMTLGVNNSIILTHGNFSSLATTIFDTDGILRSNKSSNDFFNTVYYKIYGTSTGEVFKIGELTKDLTNKRSNLILTKYMANFSKEWSLNLSTLVPSIYLYKLQVLPNNDLLFFGSFDNSNTSTPINDFYDSHLGVYSIYIYNNGTIGWKNILYITGETFYQNSVYNSNSNEVMIAGETFSYNYPSLNTNNTKYHGEGDIIINYFDDNGNPIQRSILGDSGAELVLDSEINNQGLYIIVACSYIPDSLNDGKLIIFAINSKGIPVSKVSYETEPKIELINNLIGLALTAVIVLFALSVFNIYVSYFFKSTNEFGNKRKRKVSNTNTCSFVNCPQDGSKMRSYITRNNPTSEFLVSTHNIDIGLSNAVAMKKIPVSAVDTVKKIVLKVVEQHADLNDVTLQTLECPVCQFISVNPISIPYEERTGYVRTNNLKDEDKLLYIHSPALSLSINPFPSLEIIKGYFKSILMFNKSELRDYSKEPEATKLTAFAIVLNSLLPFQFSNGAYFSAELGLNIAVYFLLFFLSGLLIIGLLHTKRQDFEILDNFRIWGIILWYNVPILALIYGINSIIKSNIIIASYSVGFLVDNARIILLLCFYGITVIKLTQLSKIRSIFATLIIFMVVSYLIAIYMVLGMLAMFMLGFLSFFGVFILCMFINRKERPLQIKDL